jgi:hypothetical protein
MGKERPIAAIPGAHATSSASPPAATKRGGRGRGATWAAARVPPCRQRRVTRGAVMKVLAR